MCLSVRRCLKRSHLVEELYENWQLDHKEAMFTSDVGELCGEWLDLAHLCQHVWRGLLDSLFENGIDNIDKTGEVFKEAVKRTRTVGGGIAALVSVATAKGFRIEQEAALRTELKEVEAIEKDIPTKWPFADRDMIAKARAAYGRGEHQGVEDLLNATQNTGSGPH